MSRNRVAILLIGKLTEEKDFSLKSLLKAFPFVPICVATNKHGRVELSKFMSVDKDLEKSYFCFHDLNKKMSLGSNLGIDELSEQYAFRSREFKQLTSWKWLLLKDVFLRHEETKTILFSDLDVYWRNTQNDVFKENKGINTVVSCQDASDSKRGKWFCTGIMIWERRQATLDWLEKLYNHQIITVNNESELDDESTFNELISLKPDFAETAALLRRESYLTGFQMLYADRVPNKKMISSSIAFHSNYILGTGSKRRALEVYENYTNGRAIKGFIDFVCVILFAKINRIVERLKKTLM